MELWLSSIFVGKSNERFVSFIPKKVGAIELNDFRPVSLIKSVCKIISKMLAERSKKVYTDWRTHNK